MKLTGWRRDHGAYLPFAAIALSLVSGFSFAKRAPAAPARQIDVESTATLGHVLAARTAAPFVEPVFASGAPALTFLAVGDTGWPNSVQRSVARAMAAERGARGADLALLLGDNFYREGVASTADPLWRTTFEDAFPKDVLPIPFLAVLGNHDHNGDVSAQIAYTGPATRWTMPARHYVRSFAAGGEDLVDFFAVDTEPLAHGLGWFGSSEESEWLERVLARSHARWRIVFGHHPARSHGSHGDNARIASEFEPLFRRYGVDLYFAGHDHDLELLPTHAPTLQVVSGAGAHTNDVTWGENTLFASAEPGFVWAGVTHAELWLVFVDRDRNELFSRHVAKAD